MTKNGQNGPFFMSTPPKYLVNSQNIAGYDSRAKLYITDGKMQGEKQVYFIVCLCLPVYPTCAHLDVVHANVRAFTSTWSARRCTPSALSCTPLRTHGFRHDAGASRKAASNGDRFPNFFPFYSL